MADDKNIRIVRGESKFAGSPNRELKLQPYLDATNRQLNEGDRNLVLNLRDQFDFERSYSTIYRLYGKIDVLYNNIISGTTQDTDFMGSMYFIPDYIGCPQTLGVPPSNCSGLPPADTFSFKLTVISVAVVVVPVAAISTVEPAPLSVIEIPEPAAK